MKHRLALPCLSLFVLAIAGCGPSHPATYRVTGKITLDGKPVSQAAVLFSPREGGKPASAATDEQGEFVLTTFKEGDGALPGKHAVSVRLVKTTGIVADRDGLSGELGPGGLQEEWIVPQRYSRAETSGLEVEVTRNMEPVLLELTSKE